MQSKASIILLTILTVAIVGSISLTYYRAFIAQDYPIHAQITCDPSVASCYVYECDPDAGECTGNPEEDITYYKLITKLAKNAYDCVPDDTGKCFNATCGPGEPDCEITYCDPNDPEVVCSGSVGVSEGEGVGVEVEGEIITNEIESE